MPASQLIQIEVKDKPFQSFFSDDEDIILNRIKLFNNLGWKWRAMQVKYIHTSRIALPCCNNLWKKLPEGTWI